MNSVLTRIIVKLAASTALGPTTQHAPWVPAYPGIRTAQQGLINSANMSPIIQRSDEKKTETASIFNCCLIYRSRVHDIQLQRLRYPWKNDERKEESLLLIVVYLTGPLFQFNWEAHWHNMVCKVDGLPARLRHWLQVEVHMHDAVV